MRLVSRLKASESSAFAESVTAPVSRATPATTPIVSDVSLRNRKTPLSDDRHTTRGRAVVIGTPDMGNPSESP